MPEYASPRCSGGERAEKRAHAEPHNGAPAAHVHACVFACMRACVRVLECTVACVCLSARLRACA
eukprot:3706136-Pleurochrysis_carterae.AAC.1